MTRSHLLLHSPLHVHHRRVKKKKADETNDKTHVLVGSGQEDSNRDKEYTSSLPMDIFMKDLGYCKLEMGIVILYTNG